jgi:hypothetical protein
LSADAVTIRVPSGENRAEVTMPPCPRSTASGFPERASQMRAALSPDAVMICLPSGEYAADLTNPLGIESSASCAPVRASQMRAVRS